LNCGLLFCSVVCLNNLLHGVEPLILIWWSLASYFSFCCSHFNDLQLLMSCLFSQYRDILLSIFAASFWFYIPHVWSSCLIFDETCICLLHIACSIVCFETIFFCVVSSNQIYFCTLLACELFSIHFLYFLRGNSFIYQYFICIFILFWLIISGYFLCDSIWLLLVSNLEFAALILMMMHYYYRVC
jgi:hypothetical protein